MTLDAQSLGAIFGGLASLLTAAAAVLVRINSAKDKELHYREQKELLYAVRETIFRDELSRLLAGGEPSEHFKAKMDAWIDAMDRLTGGK